MALQLETLDIPHLPETFSVYVALYRNVQNAAFLKQQLLSGNKEYEYAFIDASMVRRESFLNVVLKRSHIAHYEQLGPFTSPYDRSYFQGDK